MFFELAPDAYVRVVDPQETGFGPAALLARLGLRRAAKTPSNPQFALLSRGCYAPSHGRPPEPPPERVIDVARALAELLDTPEARARAEAIEHPPKRSIRDDWDAVAAWARGEAELALRAVNRALDVERIAPYLVTRAVVLLALGRVGEARYAIDAAHELHAAFDRGAPAPSPLSAQEPYVPDDATRSRAFATRARISLAEGDASRAADDYAHRRRSRSAARRGHGDHVVNPVRPSGSARRAPRTSTRSPRTLATGRSSSRSSIT